VVSTDHCPFTAADKANHEAFTTVPGGLPSIEARLSLVYHYGQAQGLSPARWVEVCCWAPARIFGLPSKGSLAPGYEADVVVFDPGRRLTIHAGSTLHERVDWSPYEGWAIKGWPRDVFCRGRQIVRDGAFVGEPGWGRFVQRTLPPDPAN
jgi:dihydropyrimidinase